MKQDMRRATWKTLLVGLCMSVVPFAIQPVAAANPTPPFISPNASWISTVNYYRAMAGLPAVTENKTWSTADVAHSCWMLWNGIAHSETPGTTNYSAAGDQAGRTGNVAVTTDINATARTFVELWTTGPFHAIGLLRYNLKTVGYGNCTSTATPKWRSAATLDVIHGLVAGTKRPTTPILWPGDGTSTSLTKFKVETPNPLVYCGGTYPTSGAGLPLMAMMPEAVTTVKTATITGPSGAVPTCALWGNKTPAKDDGAWATAKALLNGDNAVTLLPNAELQPGLYRVVLTTNARTVRWSFTVDPAAATGVMPVSLVSRAATPSTFSPMTPFRFADTRRNLRVTPLLAGVPKRIQIGGVAGISKSATALSANFTVVGSAAAGSLTIYNCSTWPPTTPNFSYARNEIVGNAAVTPLSSASSAIGGGFLCLYSPVATQVVIDVTGFFTPSALGQHYTATNPTLWTQRTINAGTALHLGTGQFQLPAGTSAVAINIAASNTTTAGFITAYGCGSLRPLALTLNPRTGTTKQNFAIVPLLPNKTLCVYSMNKADVRIDLVGYFSATGATHLTPAVVTRITDTNNSLQPLMNLGTSGQTLAANVTHTLLLAGQRGLPSDVKAVALDVTATNGADGGSITVWGGDCTVTPSGTSATYTANSIVSNTVQAALGTTGTLCIRATTATDVTIDVHGWWN